MKRVVVGGAVLALGLAGTGLSTAEQADYKVTGGGQFIASTTEPLSGAGSTIAFTAQSVAGEGKGQVQYVLRTDGTGQGQSVRHGEVTCVAAFGTSEDGFAQARIGGVFRADNDSAEQPFVIDVLDGGEGNGDTDLIELREQATDCTDDPSTTSDDFDASFSLGRGNAQIHTAK